MRLTVKGSTPPPTGRRRARGTPRTASKRCPHGEIITDSTRWISRFVGGLDHTVRMSDKTHPAGSQRETAALTAGESKGAVVITGNGMPAG
jgi:hypothetical protein